MSKAESVRNLMKSELKATVAYTGFTTGKVGAEVDLNAADLPVSHILRRVEPDVVLPEGEDCTSSSRRLEIEACISLGDFEAFNYLKSGISIDG